MMRKRLDAAHAIHVLQRKRLIRWSRFKARPCAERWNRPLKQKSMLGWRLLPLRVGHIRMKVVGYHLTGQKGYW